MRSRTRTCTNPSPKNGGKTCLEQDLGPAKETEKCNTDPCGMSCCIYKGLACIAGGRVIRHGRPFCRAQSPHPHSSSPNPPLGMSARQRTSHLRLMTTKFGE